MKIIVLGSHGMAGHMIEKYLYHQGHEVYGAARSSGTVNLYLDAESEISRYNFIQSSLVKDVDFIINCIGVLRVDAEKNPARTVLLNSWWPHYLETMFAESKTKIIHISTDCIFDGKRGWYIENDLPNETELYGRSKAMGEVNNNKDITLRMSIIGPEIKDQDKRSGLLNWVVNGAESKIFGWKNSWWNGITTLELAKQIHNYIINPVVSGVYHLVPKYTISKYYLVSYISDIFECDKEVVAIPGKEENKTLLDTRNEYRVFTKIPNYREQLCELKEFAEKISA